MKKLVAVIALAATLVAASPLAADAHGAATAALALGAFAAFSVLTWPFWAVASQPVYVYPPVVYATPPASYAPAPASYSAVPAPATPAIQREVIYAHGRHVLYGDGVTTAYRWVWVPNPPAPPVPAVAPPPPPAGAPPPPPPR